MIVLVDPALSEVGFATTVDVVVEMAAAWITVVACRKAVPLRLTVTVIVSALVSDRVMVACPELFVVTLVGVEKVAEPVVLKTTAALGITLPY